MSALKEFAAFVGIDWADEKHAVCLIESDGRRTEQNVIEQQAEALDEWIADLFRAYPRTRAVRSATMANCR